jgi:hypothetical protein
VAVVVEFTLVVLLEVQVVAQVQVLELTIITRVMLEVLPQ